MIVPAALVPLATLFAAWSGWAVSLLVLAALLALAFVGAPVLAWTVVLAALAWLCAAPTWVWIVLVPLAVVANVRPLRTALSSRPILNFMRRMKFLPVISETERVAIEAGSVWLDGELFSGRPDFRVLSSQPYPDLTERERAFLDGPVEEVCRMTDEWEVYQRRDLSAEVWDFLKEEGFLGLIIPQEYGGLGFSASANSAIVGKLASRSIPLSITAMVPNSLGPAELLVHYGTQEQKDHFLPRLASGEEVPCFALTEPNAGSDAGAIEAQGVVFRGDDGELYLRLSWRKRYITLAAISTLLGLAFKLEDPDDLLGQGTHPGITCALVPTSTDGVELGQRHDPLGVPFYNCPTEGHDVVVPVDAVIGGHDGVGRGWQMLMETLAAGRGISLPALATATAKNCARITGAYAAVRRQFGLPIGKFEGIHEPLARIGGAAYLLEAARRTTCGGLDTGAKPAVVTAMAKYNFTELARACINDAMDVVGGAGISQGPRNLLANTYTATPISITVEGANILTRTLMIFGQGAIRCHPYAYDEIRAAQDDDAGAFDRAFWGHVGHVVRNGARALLLSLSRGRLAGVPYQGPAAEYARKLSWCSASFAFLADIAMASLGGDLKRKETVTGRFSDIFSWMYLANAAIARFEAEGRQKEHEPFFRWSCEHAFARIQEAFDGLYRNIDVPVLGTILAGPVALWSRLNRIGSEPSDALGSTLAEALQVPGDLRDALTPGIWREETEQDGALGRLEHAFRLAHEADGVARKIKRAVRERRLPKGRPAELLEPAVEAGIIGRSDVELVRAAEAARDDAVQVDAFTLEEYLQSAVPPDGPAPRSMPSLSSA